MSIHRSLKTKPSALNHHRNVLTRAERIEKLTEKESFDKDASPLGLVKVANRQIVTKKKKAAETEEGDAEATTDESAASTPES
jgi:small basic protein (TIGR04137 family)